MPYQFERARLGDIERGNGSQNERKATGIGCGYYEVSVFAFQKREFEDYKESYRSQPLKTGAVCGFCNTSRWKLVSRSYGIQAYTGRL